MQRDDYQWFLDNYSQLYDQYGLAYLVIKNKSVLGAYNSYSDGIRETLKAEEPGTFIVQLCNGNESGYTIKIASTNFM